MEIVMNKKMIGNMLISIFMLLFLSISLANASTIQANNVWTDGTPYSGPIENVINQSGLSAAYTSGVDDFTTFVNGTTADIGSGVADTLGDTSAPLDNYYFDLGAAYTIDAIAIWNQRGTASLQTFDILSATDSTFTTTTNLGSFSIGQDPSWPTSGNIFNFANTSSQYFMIDVTSNFGFLSATRINEVVFNDVGAQVPEPTTMLLFGFGLLGIAGINRRKK